MLAPFDGSCPPRALTSGKHRDSAPRWSPDGSQLTFVSDRESDRSQLFLLPLGGGEAEEAVANLDKHKRFLRGLLAKKVSMKFMPELRFKVDTSFEASSRIDALLASPKVARDLNG